MILYIVNLKNFERNGDKNQVRIINLKSHERNWRQKINQIHLNSSEKKEEKFRGKKHFFTIFLSVTCFHCDNISVITIHLIVNKVIVVIVI